MEPKSSRAGEKNSEYRLSKWNGKPGCSYMVGPVFCKAVCALQMNSNLWLNYSNSERTGLCYPPLRGGKPVLVCRDFIRKPLMLALSARKTNS